MVKQRERDPIDVYHLLNPSHLYQILGKAHEYRETCDACCDPKTLRIFLDQAQRKGAPFFASYVEGLQLSEKRYPERRANFGIQESH